MKKYIKLLVVVFSVLVLTGCLKYDVSMEINDDKSVDLEFIIGVISSMENEGENTADIIDNYLNKNNDSLQEDSYNPNGDIDSNITFDYEVNDDAIEENEESTEDFINRLKEYGFTVKEYDDGEYQGYKISKKFNSIDDITSNKKLSKVNLFEIYGSETEEPLKYYFYKKGNNYVADFTFDMEAEEDYSQMDPTMISSMFKVSYKVTLPNESIENNATKVSKDGRTLTWNINVAQNNSIHYEFNFNNKETIIDFIMDNIILLIAGLVFIVLAIVLTINSKNKKQNNNSNNGQTPVMNNSLNNVQPSVMDNNLNNNQTLVMENSLNNVQTPVMNNDLNNVKPPVMNNSLNNIQTPVMNNSLNNVQPSVMDNNLNDNQTLVMENSLNNAQTPLMDNSLNNIQTPVMNNSLNNVQTPVMENSLNKVQTPVMDNNLNNVQTPVMDNNLNKVQTPVMDNSLNNVQTPPLDTNPSGNLFEPIIEPLNNNPLNEENKTNN